MRTTTMAAAVLLAVAGVAVPAVQAAGTTDSRSSSPLVYHGGPIVTKARSHLVFWTGGNRKAFNSKYVSLLQRWQKDARHTAVFKSVKQYTQDDGKHPSDTTYAGTYRVHTPFPRNAACANRCVGTVD